MSRSFKIAFILKSRSSLPLYKDLTELSEKELDHQVRSLLRRMRSNESSSIARMRISEPEICLN